MGILVCSFLWVMQDLYHQSYHEKHTGSLTIDPHQGKLVEALDKSPAREPLEAMVPSKPSHPQSLN